VFTAVAAIFAAVGGAATVVIALSGWLARIIANRIAQQDRARVDAEIERLRAGLARDSASALDALTRRREVYSTLVTSLRVFIDSGAQSMEAKAAFLRAYDEACIWGAEPIVKAIEELLDAAQQRPIDQARIQTAYRRAVLAMREDSGHPGTAVQYRFVKF
jgi:hypothetical protein